MTGLEHTRSADDELAALLESRRATYALLARLYRRELDEALLADLRAARWPASTGDADADEGYRLIARYLSSRGSGALTELARDFAHTFIGHGQDASSAAYPYESVYTSEKRLLMQDARDEMLKLARREGIAKSKDWCETEDHIAFELEFMATLAGRTRGALAENEAEAARLLGVQRDLLCVHLLVWTPAFTADMRSFARTGFYCGLACLTDGFLRTDREFFDSLSLDPGGGAGIGTKDGGAPS